MTTAQAAPEVNTRLEEVFLDLLTSLRTLITKHRVTFEEYRQAIGFLEEVSEQGELALMMDVFLGVAVDDAAYPADLGTESNIEGPFYVPGAPVLEPPYELPRRLDEPGDILFFSGSVQGADGSPLAGAVLDLWQADAEGNYSHFHPGVPEFNLRGRFETDDQGRFEVRTVVPPPYEIPKAGPTGRLLSALGRHCFRPAHIHVKASHPGHQLLTTQLYFEGDPWLDSDVVESVKAPLVITLSERSGDGGDNGRSLACSYDFFLRPLVTS